MVSIFVLKTAEVPSTPRAAKFVVLSTFSLKIAEAGVDVRAVGLHPQDRGGCACPGPSVFSLKTAEVAAWYWLMMLSILAWSVFNLKTAEAVAARGPLHA